MGSNRDIRLEPPGKQVTSEADAELTRQPGTQYQQLRGNAAAQEALPLPPGATPWQEPSLRRCLGESTVDLLGEFTTNLLFNGILADTVSDSLGPGEGGLASGMRPDRPGYVQTPDRKPLPEQLFNTALAVPTIGGIGATKKAVSSTPRATQKLVKGGSKWLDDGGEATARALRDAGHTTPQRPAILRSIDSARRPRDLPSVRAETMQRGDAVRYGEVPTARLLEQSGQLDTSIERAYRYRPEAELAAVGTDRKAIFRERLGELEGAHGPTSSIDYLSEQPLSLWHPGGNFAWLRGVADRGLPVHHITPEDSLFRMEQSVGRSVPTFTNEELRYLHDLGYTRSGTVLKPPPGLSELPGDLAPLGDLATAGAGLSKTAARLKKNE